VAVLLVAAVRPQVERLLMSFPLRPWERRFVYSAGTPLDQIDSRCRGISWEEWACSKRVEWPEPRVVPPAFLAASAEVSKLPISGSRDNYGMKGIRGGQI
jgi:hypothetical protein